MLIGIAGKIGSGKSHVARLLEERGWRTLDLDIVAHRALKEKTREIVDIFGDGLLVDGHIDRKALGHLVFSDEESLRRLEEVTYPWIEEKTREWIAEDKETPAAIHAINLHKTKLHEECDAVIWVSAPRRVRKKRVAKRDNRPWKELKDRFRSQKALNPKVFSQHAEIYSVRNSKNDASVNASLERVLRRLKRIGRENQ
ncbi:MAG: dephospho-CoA kinase [Spirochaetaceae bacterium]|nr:dephospho-CoA kinase [Spirochaetaceae bacterium]